MDPNINTWIAAGLDYIRTPSRPTPRPTGSNLPPAEVARRRQANRTARKSRRHNRR